MAGTLAGIQQAHHAKLLSIRRLAEQLVAQSWDAYGGLTDEALEQFAASAASVSRISQQATANAAVAFMSANDRASGLGTAPIRVGALDIRNRADPAEVYARSVIAARRSRAGGATIEQALNVGRARAETTARTDVMLANREAMEQGAETRPWVVGYRRVLTGVSCALCASASTQRYNRANLHPIHPNCDCDVAEIFGTEDPGQVINRKLLDDLQEAGRKTDTPDYYRRDAPYVVDENGVVRYRQVEVLRDANGKRLTTASGRARTRITAGDPVVAEIRPHGELGELLTDQRHAFQAADDIADVELPEPAPAVDLGKLSPAARRALNVPDVVTENVPKPRKARRVLGVDDPDVIAMAARYDVTPDEILVARKRIGDVKGEIYEVAERVQAEAFERLDDWQALKLTRPPRKTAGRHGEWDFLDDLAKGEKARLSRTFYTDTPGFGPDQLAETMKAFGDVPSDAGTDELMDMWLETTRRYEAAGAVRRGKLPSGRAYSGTIDVDDLIRLADERYDVGHIMRADELEVAGHIASIDRQILLDEAVDFLGSDSLAPEFGPSPWRMSFQAWEDEVRTLEYGLREHPGEMAAIEGDARQRLRELIPPMLDDGQDFEDLYAAIVTKAQQGGLEVPDHVGIPWQQ